MFELQVGDVIHCPGYDGIKHPAKITVVDSESNFEEPPLTLNVKEANRMFPRYAKASSALKGSFWKVHRPAPAGLVQVWPEVKDA